MPDGRQLPSLDLAIGCSCRIRLSARQKFLHSPVQAMVNRLCGRMLKIGQGGWHTCCLTRCRLHHVSSDPVSPMTAYHFNRRK